MTLVIMLWLQRQRNYIIIHQKVNRSILKSEVLMFCITKIGIKTIIAMKCVVPSQKLQRQKLYGTSRIFVSSRLPFTFTLDLKRVLSFLMDWKASSLLQGLQSSLEYSQHVFDFQTLCLMPTYAIQKLLEYTVDAFSKSFINAFQNYLLSFPGADL